MSSLVVDGWDMSHVYTLEMAIDGVDALSRQAQENEWSFYQHEKAVVMASRVRFILTQLLWPSAQYHAMSEAVKALIFRSFPDSRVFVDHTCIFIYEICIQLRQEGKHITFETVYDVYMTSYKEKQRELRHVKSGDGILDWMMTNLDPCHTYYGGPAMPEVIMDYIERLYDDFITNKLANIYNFKKIALSQGLPIEESDRFFGDLEIELKNMKPKKQVGMSSQVNDALDSLLNFKVGLTTGSKNLDQIIGGWQDGCLYIIAGRPAMGKTAVALSFTMASMRNSNKKTLFFSLEMPAIQLIKRMACNMTGLSHELLVGQPFVSLASDVQDQFKMAFDAIKTAPLEIVDKSGLSIDELRSICDLKKRSEDIGLIVVDYLQLMTAQADIREQEIAKISRGLKALSKEMGCPVVALAQINRGVEQRANKRPLLSDLRESGSIEQDADAVIMLYRESVYNKDEFNDNSKDMELIVTKNRHGMCGTAEVDFYGDCQRIIDKQRFF